MLANLGRSRARPACSRTSMLRHFRQPVRFVSRLVAQPVRRVALPDFLQDLHRRVWDMSCDEISADRAAQRSRGLDVGVALFGQPLCSSLGQNFGIEQMHYFSAAVGACLVEERDALQMYRVAVIDCQTRNVDCRQDVNDPFRPPNRWMRMRNFSCPGNSTDYGDTHWICRSFYGSSCSAAPIARLLRRTAVFLRRSESTGNFGSVGA